MVTRSLTEVFILMRNNAAHSRQVFGDQTWSERARLVDAERGEGVLGGGESLPPPVWQDSLEEAKYTVVRLRRKLEELKAAHARHLQRPTLDEGSDEDRQVTRIAAEMKRHLATAQRILRDINAYTRQGKPIERKVAGSAVASLVASLQEISLSFRDAQTAYLKSLTSREERSNAYLDLPNFEELSLDDPAPSIAGAADDMFQFGHPTSLMDAEPRTMTQTQLLALEEENTKMAEQREREVNGIVRSIVDLNDIFKDLAHMVSEQGTVLDRIDYNIEQTQVQVQEGFRQLKKADGYQRKNRKMHCILILGVTVIVSVFVLVIVKA